MSKDGLGERELGRILAQKSVDLGPVEDFPEGQFRMVQVGRREIGILRSRNGCVYAIANVCPHRGAPLCKGGVGGTLLPSEPGDLVYGLNDEVVRCPWHGYEFSLATGECLFIGLRLRARTYHVEVHDGRVHLHNGSGGRAGSEKGEIP